MLRKKAIWIGLVALAIVGGGGYVVYTRWLAPQGTADGNPVLQTATATRGSISVTAAGSGVLVASSEVSLAFSASSKVDEILVEVGDRVQAGDVLAWTDDTAARQSVAEAEQGVIDAQTSLVLAVARAELAVAQAEANLASAQEDLAALVDWTPDSVELDLAKADLYGAQVSYQNTVAKASMIDQQNASVRINLDQAIAALVDAQQAYAEAMNPERDWERNIEETRESAANSLVKAQQNLEIAQANYDLALIDGSAADVQSSWAKVLDAEESLANLEAPPDAADIATAQRAVRDMELALQEAQLELGENQTVAQRKAELTLEQAELKLAAAQETLDGMVLVAPFAGTVVEVNIEVGETASGTAIVVSDLDHPIVQFWVEESDMNSVALGNPVDIVFTALPDLTYTGEVFQIDPKLVTVSNTPAVQAWATVDTGVHPVTLLGDMNGDVDIVAGEAINVVLVPVQALRKLGEDQYAVFVVQPNGELELRLVEVGLQDFVNAEIISGVEVGEVVSTGEATAAVTSATDTGQETFPNMGQMLLQGGGMQGGGGRP